MQLSWLRWWRRGACGFGKEGGKLAGGGRIEVDTGITMIRRSPDDQETGSGFEGHPLEFSLFFCLSLVYSP